MKSLFCVEHVLGTYFFWHLNVNFVRNKFEAIDFLIKDSRFPKFQVSKIPGYQNSKLLDFSTRSR